jgi:high-affinity iron transporter
MLFSFLVTVREGVEMALIITILLGYLRSTGQQRHFRDIWLGVGVAAGICIVFATVLEIAAQELDESVTEAFEGFTMLVAVALLTAMAFWMKKQARGISRELREQLNQALSSGSVAALVLLAASSVGREGLETTLFLFAGSRNGSAGIPFLLGGIGGFALAAVIGASLYYGTARIPLKQFFSITGVVVLVLAAGLISNGIAHLHEAGVLENIGARPWDTDSFISITSNLGKFLNTLLGYDSAPSILQIVLYWTYLIVAVVAYAFLPFRRPSWTRRLSRHNVSAAPRS